MLILNAIKFASEKHNGQVRKTSGLPYVTHPIIVMELIQKFKGESTNLDSLKCAALLHDTLEDTKTDYFEIERLFGPMVASIVLELTNDEKTIETIGKLQYLKNKMLTMSKYAFVIKLVDRLSNVIDSPSQQYMADTLELMNYLMHYRVLTERQTKIINEIVSNCVVSEVSDTTKLDRFKLDTTKLDRFKLDSFALDLRNLTSQDREYLLKTIYQNDQTLYEDNFDDFKKYPFLLWNTDNDWCLSCASDNLYEMLNLKEIVYMIKERF